MRWRQAVAFALVGALSTLLHLGGFWALRATGLLSAQVANAVALVAATVANTAANRRWTFGVTGRAGAARQQMQGFVVLAITLATTSGALALLHLAVAHPPGWVETGAVAVATLASTALKLVLMRRWMFRAATTGAATQYTVAMNVPASSSK